MRPRKKVLAPVPGGGSEPETDSRAGFFQGSQTIQSTTPIPLIDLKAQYLSIKDEIDAAVARVLSSGRFILGGEVARFEEEFAAFCGAKHCVGTASKGTRGQGDKGKGRQGASRVFSLSPPLLVPVRLAILLNFGADSLQHQRVVK